MGIKGIDYAAALNVPLQMIVYKYIVLHIQWCHRI